MEHKVYKGLIEIGDYGESDKVLFVGRETNTDPLCDILMDDREEFGEYLTVRYYICSEEIDEKDLLPTFLKQLLGGPADNIEYVVHYSEDTGYLWTDENLIVGGHDLLEELRGYAGYWLHMEIDFSKESAGIERSGGNDR